MSAGVSERKPRLAVLQCSRQPNVVKSIQSSLKNGNLPPPFSEMVVAFFVSAQFSTVVSMTPS